MKRKYGNKFLNKKSFSLVVACSLLASFAGISIANFSNVHSTKNVSTSLKDSNSTQQQSVTDDITSFNSYDILASTNTIAPVISADGVVGWTSNHKTLTLTTYDGVLVWKLTFANNEDITSFYKTNYSSQTISEIQINNYVYLPSENILVVLLGSSSNTNQVVVGINMSTGTLFNPTPSSDGSINYIVKVKDGRIGTVRVKGGVLKILDSRKQGRLSRITARSRCTYGDARFPVQLCHSLWKTEKQKQAKNKKQN